MITIYDPTNHIARTITRDRERETRSPQQSAILQVDARTKRQQQLARARRTSTSTRPNARVGHLPL